jgi:hypothetical protein
VSKNFGPETGIHLRKIGSSRAWVSLL